MILADEDSSSGRITLTSFDQWHFLVSTTFLVVVLIKPPEPQE